VEKILKRVHRVSRVLRADNPLRGERAGRSARATRLNGYRLCLLSLRQMAGLLRRPSTRPICADTLKNGRAIGYNYRQSMMEGRQVQLDGLLTSFRSNDTLLKSTYCGRSTASSILRACGPTWRPSIDPELLIRMLILGYCFGIGSERRLCEEVDLNLAYRWFCRLGLDGSVP